MNLFDTAYRNRLQMEWALGWLNVPIQAGQYYLLLLAVFGRSYWLEAAQIVAAGTIALDLIGWWGVQRKGYLKRQNTMSNQHNEEMMRAARRRKA